MNTCKQCEGKGFIEYFTARDARNIPAIAQCPGCKDTAAYSREVSKRYAQKPLAHQPFAKLTLVKS